jgi:hypothetical protein
MGMQAKSPSASVTGNVMAPEYRYSTCCNVTVSYGSLQKCCSRANRVVLETSWGVQDIVKMGGNDLLD